MNRRSFLTGAASTVAIAASGGVGAVAGDDSWDGRYLINGAPGDWRGVSDHSYEAYLRYVLDHLRRSVDLPYEELIGDWRGSQGFAVRELLATMQASPSVSFAMPSQTGCTLLGEVMADRYDTETITIEGHTGPSKFDPGRSGHPKPEGI